MLNQGQLEPAGFNGEPNDSGSKSSLLTACVCLLKYSTKEDKYEEEIKLLEEKLKEVRWPLAGNRGFETRKKG